MSSAPCDTTLADGREHYGTHHDGRLEAILDVVLGKVLVRDVLHEALLVHDRFAIWEKKEKNL